MEKSNSNDKICRRLSVSTWILLILTLLAALFIRTNGLSKLDLGFDETLHRDCSIEIMPNVQYVPILFPSVILYFLQRY